jgi:predicted metal-binding protein
LSKHILFVCYSCHHASEKYPNDRSSETVASAISLSFRQLIWIKALRSQKILKLRSPSLFGYIPFF